MITITLETRRAVVVAAYVVPSMLSFLSGWIGRNYDSASYWLIIPAAMVAVWCWSACVDLMLSDGPDDGDTIK